MVDHLTKSQRSYCMSRIRSKWTSPEKKLHNHLKGRKIKHIMHPKIPGSPDIIFPDGNLALFVDGCFWHRCPKCYRRPKTNAPFWRYKVKRNKKKDLSDVAELRKHGWNVMRLWEHEINGDIQSCVGKVKSSFKDV
jgi:DNA mismatch endonuclease (patch repair protein)